MIALKAEQRLDCFLSAVLVLWEEQEDGVFVAVKQTDLILPSLTVALEKILNNLHCHCIVLPPSADCARELWRASV